MILQLKDEVNAGGHTELFPPALAVLQNVFIWAHLNEPEDLSPHLLHNLSC